MYFSCARKYAERIERSFTVCHFKTSNANELFLREFRRPFESVSSFSASSRNRVDTYWPSETSVESVQTYFTCLHGSTHLPCNLDHDSPSFWKDIQKICSTYSDPSSGCFLLGHHVSVSALVEISALLSNIQHREQIITDELVSLDQLADQLLSDFETFHASSWPQNRHVDESTMTRTVWSIRVIKIMNIKFYKELGRVLNLTSGIIHFSLNLIQ